MSHPHCRNCGADGIGPYYCEECGFDGIASPMLTSSDDEPGDDCTNSSGHSWVYSGSAYGGDDDSYHGEGRCYCEFCGADGDA
jgi:hypothetical protein